MILIIEGKSNDVVTLRNQAGVCLEAIPKTTFEGALSSVSFDSSGFFFIATGTCEVSQRDFKTASESL